MVQLSVVAPALNTSAHSIRALCSNPLFEKRPKSFGIGQDLAPKRNLHRFVKWPKYVRIQRQRRVLNQRLKVPPTLNQFSKTLDKNAAQTLFTLLMKYRPEDAAAKKERLLAEAKARADGKEVRTALAFPICMVPQMLGASLRASIAMVCCCMTAAGLSPVLG